MTPRLVQLVRAQFPSVTWATSLVNLFNQFVLETVAALAASSATYKTLSFVTGATVADSFPIDFPVETAPNEVRIAQAPAGTSANTVKWAAIVANGKLVVRVSLITGLSANSSYSVRLAYQ